MESLTQKCVVTVHLELRMSSIPGHRLRIIVTFGGTKRMELEPQQVNDGGHWSVWLVTVMVFRYIHPKTRICRVSLEILNTCDQRWRLSDLYKSMATVSGHINRSSEHAD